MLRIILMFGLPTSTRTTHRRIMSGIIGVNGTKSGIIDVSQSGSIFYTDSVEFTADGVGADPGSGYLNSGDLVISVPAATVAKCSKIICIASGSCQVNSTGSYAFMEARIGGTTDFERVILGAPANVPTINPVTIIQSDDVSSIYSARTFIVEIRKASGNAAYCNTMIYNHGGWRMSVFGTV